MAEYQEYGWNDENANSFGFIYPKIKDLCKCAKTILDVGCGNGAMANALRAEGYTVYGIDASKEGIEVANRLSNNEGYFYVSDFDNGSIPEELQKIEFDTVISTEVIEHVYSPQQYMKYIKNCLLQRGGRLIISTPYHGYLKNLMLSICNGWDAHHTVLWEGGHIKFWSKKTLTQLLEDNGFTVEKFVGCGRMPYLWKSMILVASKKGEKQDK